MVAPHRGVLAGAGLHFERHGRRDGDLEAPLVVGHGRNDGPACVAFLGVGDLELAVYATGDRHGGTGEWRPQYVAHDPSAQHGVPPGGQGSGLLDTTDDLGAPLAHPPTECQVLDPFGPRRERLRRTLLSRREAG